MSQSILDRHPDPITYHAPVLGSTGDVTDFTLIYCNESQRRQANLPVDDMIGQKVSELFGYSEEGRQRLLKQLNDVWNTGQDVENTYYNEILDTFFRVHRRKVEGGILTVAKNVNAEMNERQEKERQTELSSQVLNTALDAWFTCEVMFDPYGEVTDFLFTRINRGFTNITGFAENHVIGRRYLELFPSAKEQGTFDLNVRVFQTGMAERLQMPYHADGLNAWFEVAVSKLGQASILVTFADITPQIHKQQELQRTNELLNGILENSASGISFGSIIRDENGNIVDGKPILANEAALRFAGIPRELYFTKSAAQLEPNIHQSLYFQRIIHTMETGQPSSVEYQVESSGNWIQITLSRMDYHHLIIVYTDITESKQAQHRQQQLLEELQRSNKQLEEFAHAASHDLKEPIRKIVVFSERLRASMRNRMNEGELQMFDRLQNASERMNQLIDDLLTYTHVNRSAFELEEVDLNEKLVLVLSDLEVAIQDKGAQITVAALPVVKGHRRQLQQLFQNLLSNALKYSKADVPPQITITSSVVSGDQTPLNLPLEKRYHLIEVKDNGIGFEQKYAERIFQMFDRLHGKSEYAGTGIGLAIVKKVVENHQGHIWAESEPGSGSTFKMLLAL